MLKGVTSLEKLLGHPVKMEEVADRVVEHFGAVFRVDVEEVEESIKARS